MIKITNIELAKKFFKEHSWDPEQNTFEEFSNYPEAADVSRNKYDVYVGAYMSDVLKKQKKEQQKAEKEAEKIEKERKKAEKEAKKETERIEKEQKKAEKEAKKQAEKEALERLIKANEEKGYKCTDKGVIRDLLCNYISYLGNLQDITFHTDAINHKSYINDEEITDKILSELTCSMNQELNIGGIQNMRIAAYTMADNNKVNPLMDNIVTGLWDGKERIKRFFIDFLGARDDKFIETLTFKWFYSLIKRLFEPGCNADSMLILVDSNQGTGKTTIFKRLIESISPKGTKYYFIQKGGNINKDTYISLSSTYLTIMDELATLDKNDIQFLKSFITETSDEFRRPYDIANKTYQRMCVFCGTTNSNSFLKDYSNEFGPERRFWTIPCCGTPRSAAEWNSILTDEYLQQMWYELYDFYNKNPKYDYTLNPDEQDMLYLLQKDYKSSNEDMAITILEDILHRVYPEDIDLDTPLSKIQEWIKNGLYSNYDGYMGEIKEMKLSVLKVLLNNTKGGGGRGTDWMKAAIRNFFNNEFELDKIPTTGRPIDIIKKKEIL